jgi:hypothetical protein
MTEQFRIHIRLQKKILLLKMSLIKILWKVYQPQKQNFTKEDADKYVRVIEFSYLFCYASL